MKRETCPHDRHRVLVVDDDPEIRAVLNRLLAQEGMESVLAADGPAALELAASTSPCVGILDLQMPGMGGIELCRHLKQASTRAQFPIVLMSGNLAEADLEAGLNAGASDFLRKPFELDDLRCRIQVLLRVHELTLAQQQSREQLQAISQAAKDAIIMMDSRGDIAFWNQSAEEMFGYTRAEAVGRNLHELLAPVRFREAHLQALPEFRLSGQGGAIGKVVELVAARKSGEEFPIELSLAATHLGGQRAAVGIVRDVTKRRALEDSLRCSEERQRSILDGLPVGVALVGRDRKIRWANQTVLRMTQSDGCQDEVTGVHCGSVLCEVEGGSCPVLDLGQRVLGVERRIPRRDGTTLSVLQSVHEVEFGGESVLLEAFVDLTERKHLELELVHARKLEAVGQLAAGIAHEINTPIQFVGDSVAFLKEAFEAIWRLIPHYRQAVGLRSERNGGESVPARIAELEREVDLEYLIENVPGALDRCDDGVRRVTKIVRAMKEFAHPDGAERSPADLNQAIQSTLVIARNEYKYVAEVEMELGELPPVACYLGDLNQAILNLIVNAAHAIGEAIGPNGEKGKIRVRTWAEPDTVSVEISDTGTGIPEKIRDRVFDPFFTTKPVGRGSGQGLAIARSVVVEKHRGTIGFQTAAGRGTTFLIRLPLAEIGPVPIGGRE